MTELPLRDGGGINWDKIGGTGGPNVHLTVEDAVALVKCNMQAAAAATLERVAKWHEEQMLLCDGVDDHVFKAIHEQSAAAIRAMKP